MTRHESSVNYQNLIRDLAEMYPFDVTEVVLTELIANSLDAGADTIEIDYEPKKKVLSVSDNGKGMSAATFEQYHDFAAGLKTRGDGIGFAGVGAKISFNVADKVITETRSGDFFGGSDWRLESNKQLIWSDIEPSHIHDHGTKVEIHFSSDTLPQYKTSQDIVTLIRRHYLPLIENDFLALYSALGQYPSNFRFKVNGKVIEPNYVEEELCLDKVKKFVPKKADKRIGYGLFGLTNSEYTLGGDLCGVLLCTHGKIIKSDFFNQFPGKLGPRIFGLVEIPKFIDFLTTSKTDFTRNGKLREFESHYGPIRESFKAWLSELGVEVPEETGSDEALKIEKEIKKLLDDIPQLSELFGFRSRKTILQSDNQGEVKAEYQEGIDGTFPEGEGQNKDQPGGPVDVGNEPGKALSPAESGIDNAKPISRTGRRGPKIALQSASDRMDLAWVDGNSIVINSGHAAYLKVRSDSANRRLHSLFSVATALQRFFVTEGTGGDLTDFMFVDRMMSSWGNK